MLSKWLPKLPIIAVLILAAALRFWGLRWGLPNSLHSYSYHPDEFLTIGAAGFVLTGFLPRFYNYPSLYLYLGAFAIVFASAYGLAHDTGAAYLCARVVTAAMGVGAIAAVYWAGRSLWRASDDRPGHVVLDAGSPGHVVPDAQAMALLAALVLCIAPLHVQHSHFATVDVPSTLFVAACLGFAGKVLSRGSWRDYLLCGVMAGLAAGTKYNAGMVVLALIAAHFLGSSEEHDRHGTGEHRSHVTREHPELVEGRSRVLARARPLRCLLGALGCVIAAFVVSTPGSVLRTKDFLYGLTYEMHHAAQGHGLVFAGTGNGFIFTFTSSLWYGLGPALAILFVAAAIYGLVRLDKRALVLLAFALPYYALISLSQVRFARYALPIFPPAALLIAWMAHDLWTRFPKGIKWAWAGLFGAILAGTLLYTIALDRLFVLPDPKDRAARWIFANIPKGSRIGVIEVPWFYSPPYSKDAGLGALPQRRQAIATSPYRVEVFRDYGFWAPWFRADFLTDWIVLSDYETQDALRFGSGRGLVGDSEMALARRLRVGISWIGPHYRRRVQFTSPLQLFGVSFGSTQSLPHDMRYPAPCITIYEAGAQVRRWMGEPRR